MLEILKNMQSFSSIFKKITYPKLETYNISDTRTGYCEKQNMA